MQIEPCILRSEEQILFKLRDLYRKYGYTCFKMSKFEEYDLYGRHKDFLVSDHVITFNDIDGKLMALKPDVTLSIVKNFRDGDTGVSRLYYNENVYRVSPGAHAYREIMQAGLECLGQLSEYNLCEVVGLAAMSLSAISPQTVLSISHMGILSALLSQIDAGEDTQELLRSIDEKNGDGVLAICQRRQVAERQRNMLYYLATAVGDPEALIAQAREIADDSDVSGSLTQLEHIVRHVRSVCDVQIQVDFSLVGDLNYYNAIVFRGYVAGIPACVLRGGQYDQLMEKMGNHSNAIGFAVYLDQLERMTPPVDYDVDVLLLYRSSCSTQAISRRIQELVEQGQTVSAQTEIPEKLTYRTLEYLDDTAEGGTCNG